jgi:hypothetical protein
MTPGSSCGPESAGLSLVEGAARLGIDPGQLWVEYLAMGGHLAAAEVQAALNGTRELEPREHNFLAAALNEYFVDCGEDHAVNYRHDSGIATRPWDEPFRP